MAPRITCDCGTCKKCKKRAYMRRYLRDHPEKNDKAGWRARNPGRHTRQKSRTENTPPAKRRAQNAVASALRNGTLTRPSSCERCARTCKPVAHHRDYDRPLEVEWICRSCHGREHSPYE